MPRKKQEDYHPSVFLENRLTPRRECVDRTFGCGRHKPNRYWWAYNGNDILSRHGDLGGKLRQGILRFRPTDVGVEGTHQKIGGGEDAKGQEMG